MLLQTKILLLDKCAAGRHLQYNGRNCECEYHACIKLASRCLVKAYPYRGKIVAKDIGVVQWSKACVLWKGYLGAKCKTNGRETNNYSKPMNKAMKLFYLDSVCQRGRKGVEGSW